MSVKYKVGIIGTGRIANRFIKEAESVDSVVVVAVYNPNITSAQSFAEKYGLKYMSSIQGLFECADIVYIASPHDSHVDYTRQALMHGKHVLCEKPLAFSEREAGELYELADKNNLVLMEAVKTACFPGYRKLIEVANSGVIGEIKYIDASFTKLLADEAKLRELNNVPYRGSFFELGSYGLLPVISLFGNQLKDVSFDCIRNANDTDIFTKATIHYDNKFASVACGLGVKTEGKLVIAGTLGYILVPAPWWLTRDFEVHFEDPDKIEYYHETLDGDGLRYEIREIANLINVKNSNSSIDNSIEEKRSLTVEQSVAMARVMEIFYEKSYHIWNI